MQMTAILVGDKNISTVETLLQRELEVTCIIDGLTDNELSLRLGNTESILFGSKPRLRSKSNLKIECKGGIKYKTPWSNFETNSDRREHGKFCSPEG